MHGRMIHGEKNGQVYEESQNYDIHGRVNTNLTCAVFCKPLIIQKQAIRAVDRAGLNKRLLDELDQLPNVKLIFNHKLLGADFNKNKAWFERRDEGVQQDHAQNPTQPKRDSYASTEIEISFDFMIGADGAHSAVRHQLMKFTRMSYMQEYIETLWCEFHMDPTATNDFQISPNHLHIWPGGEFMFIAIPSLDKSFTCTLFLPGKHYAEIDRDPSCLITFFNKHFPGIAGRLISEANLVKQYKENPHLPLISIKCAPYHYSSSAVILGDSAHAMVPFYGQGMNAGLEDVRVLFEHLDANTGDPTGRTAALEAYSAHRAPDAAAINDLALRNYQEMRAHVTSPLYRLRKWTEEKMNIYLPSAGFATQYSRVSFGNVRYSEVEKLAKRQGHLLLYGMAGVVGLLVPALSYAGWAVWRWERASRASKMGVKGMAHLGWWSERIGRIFT
jgi:kynurenine 3-monooxygenase